MALAEQADTSVGVYNLVQRYLDLEDDFKVQDVVSRIIDELPEEDLRAALALTLPAYVRQYATRARRNSQTATERRAGLSKWKLNADPAWETKLDSHIAVGDGYKRLRDCTAQDMRFAVERYMNLAEAYGDKASAGAALIDAMKEHKAESVGALPDDVLAKYVPVMRPDR